MNNNTIITLTVRDWNELADVMRSLTWGTQSSDKWWRLYNKVLESSEKKENHLTNGKK